MGRNDIEDVPVVVDVLCEMTEVVDPGERVKVNSLYDAQNVFRHLSFTWTLKLQAVSTSINTRLFSLDCRAIGLLPSSSRRQETGGTCQEKEICYMGQISFDGIWSAMGISGLWSVNGLFIWLGCQTQCRVQAQ